MKKISLSEVEANDLLDLYQSEIDRAQRRINNLKSIIKKLSDGYSDEHSEEKPAKIKGKRGRRPNVKPVAAKVIIEEKEINEKELTKEPLKKGRKKKEEAEKTAPIKKARNKKTIKAKAPKKSGRKPKSLRNLNALLNVGIFKRLPIALSKIIPEDSETFSTYTCLNAFVAAANPSMRSLREVSTTKSGIL